MSGNHYPSGRVVPDASGASDGHVLTADGLGGYAWEAPAAPSGTARRTTLGPTVTGSIAASNGTENVNVALPAGVTACEIVRLSITRTDGTGTSASIDAYTLDDRSDGTPRTLFGSAFGGITVDPGPEYGPAIDAGGSRFFSPVSYINADGSEFIRLTVTNRDGANVATYSISIVIVY